MKIKSHPYIGYLLVLASVVLVGCENLDRSRDTANPKVAGKVLAEQVCATCHGLDGNSVSPFYPKLAGQQPQYLITQIENFRSHQRSDAVGVQHMWGLAKNLTDAQIKEIADYYAAQPSLPIHEKANATELAEGKLIYEKGIPDKGTPPCFACHGQNGQGRDGFPRLANQHADYLVKQLKVFQETNDRPGTPMEPVTHPMTYKDIEAVALYLQDFPEAGK
jgi:cytochrome c553